MPVYMIRAGEDGPVKIGVTGDVAARLRKMQSDSAATLTLIRVLDGEYDVEQALHERFAPLRLRGEWFTFHPDMMGDVGVRNFTPAELTPEWRGDLRRFIKEKGIKQRDVVKALGTSEAAVSLWLSRRADIPVRFILPLAEFIGIPAEAVLSVATKSKTPA